MLLLYLLKKSWIFICLFCLDIRDPWMCYLLEMTETLQGELQITDNFPTHEALGILGTGRELIHEIVTSVTLLCFHFTF